MIKAIFKSIERFTEAIPLNHTDLLVEALCFVGYTVSPFLQLTLLKQKTACIEYFSRHLKLENMMQRNYREFHTSCNFRTEYMMCACMHALV